MVPLLVSTLFPPSQTAAALTGIRLSFGFQWCCIREEQNLIPWVTFVVPIRTWYPFGYLFHSLFKNQAISVWQCWWNLKWQRWKTWHFPGWTPQYGGVGRYLCAVTVSFLMQVAFVIGALKEGFTLLMLPLIPWTSEGSVFWYTFCFVLFFRGKALHGQDLGKLWTFLLALLQDSHGNNLCLLFSACKTELNNLFHLTGL